MASTNRSDMKAEKIDVESASQRPNYMKERDINQAGTGV
jgi:hypothetical protein